MGLTIHYSLALNSRSTTKARKLVEQLRQRALALPMASVGEVIDVTGDAADFQKLPDNPPLRWLLIQSRWHTQVGRYSYSTPPSRVIGFVTNPGDGCEPANFGLCQFPASIEIDNHEYPFGKKKVRTGAKGWCWHSFCKTQYSSNFSCGGVENFLRCHLSVIAMLDHAKTLGILGEVSDEGDFWQKRDVEALAKEVGEWNVQLAGFAGKLKDQIGSGLEAAILKYPDFEHLEAKGREHDAH
jgi:hypothetical protein